MHRIIASLAAVAVVLTAGLAPAQAGGRHHRDAHTLDAVSTVVGAGTTAGYFALNDWHWKWDSARHGITSTGATVFTTIGCMALSPMVATAVLNRPLTYREAHVMMGACLIPIIGGWLVDEAYEHHVLWAPDEPKEVAWKSKKAWNKRHHPR